MEQKTKLLDKAIYLLGLCFMAFQVYTAIFGLLDGLNQRVVHLGFVLALGVLVLLQKNKIENKGLHTILNAVFVVLFAVSLVSTFYGVKNGNALLSIRNGVFNSMDVIMGIATIVLVLYLTWKYLGPALPLLAILFIAYAKWGNMIPGYFGNKGYSVKRIVTQLYLGYEGIYGTAIAAVCTYIVLYIIFGGLLGAIGATEVFSDLANALVGHVRGGPAKVAVVASSLFGTMSGSVTANVVGTGSFTIPMMKKSGYSSEFAGAVEATASCGGQIMPPVMGVAAFIIAEYLGTPYSYVLKSAVIPALLYFIGVFVAVDLHSARSGLNGLPKNQLPVFKETFKHGWPFLIPLVLMIYLLAVLQVTNSRGALLGNLCCLVIGLLLMRTKCINPILDSLVDSAKSLVPVALGTATAGIVIGMFSLTGLGFKLSSALIALSGGNVFVLLLLTMIAALILGMGLPTVAAYILLATLVVPALTEMDVLPIAAHLFVFYFGVISNITPPVCLGVFAACGIAHSKPLPTAWNAVKLAIPAFIVPYVFVYDSALLLKDASPLECIYSLGVVLIGVLSLSMGVFGYCLVPLKAWERTLIIVGGCCMILTSKVTDLIGVVLIAAIVLMAFLRKKRQDTATTQVST